jgi:hypothetical protein
MGILSSDENVIPYRLGVAYGEISLLL